MNIQSLKSVDLVTQLKTLVTKEKALTLEIIDYLAEVSRRRLYLPKYTSLFSFMVEELGYCPSLAQLRLNSLKALQVVPEVREKVLNNEVSLNTLAKAQSFINKENKELKIQAEAPLTKTEQRELFAAVMDTPAQKVEEVLQAKRYEMEVQKAEAMNLPHPLEKPAKRKITFEADAELLNFIDEVKSLLSHNNPAGDLATNLKKVLPLAIRELKIAKGLLKRSEIESKTAETKMTAAKSEDEQISTSSMKFKESQRKKIANRLKVKSRAIPMALKRAVWERDKGCCQYLDAKTNRRCGSRHQVQFDHIKPWSFGGEHTMENIELKCSIHNRFRWEAFQKS